MSAVFPQPGARTSLVAALLVVGGGLLLAFVLIKGMLALLSAYAFMQGPALTGEPVARPVPSPPK